MPGLITEAVSARLEMVGAFPRVQDLYAGTGTDFYEPIEDAALGADSRIGAREDGPTLDRRSDRTLVSCLSISLH